MALGTFIAGRYSATWNTADIGIMEDGYELSWQWSVEAINNTDRYGDQWIDGIYRGLTNVFCQCNSLEYKTGSAAAITPWAAILPTGVSGLASGVIGRLVSNNVGTLVLTATAATPAATTPATLTTASAILAENVDVKLLFNSKLRKVPIRFRFVTYNNAGADQYFTTT